MNKKLDELLRRGLAPTEEPDSRLNQKILDRQSMAREASGLRNRKTGYFGSRPVPAAVFAAVLVIGAVSLTAAAAYKYLTPAKLAEESGDVFLAEAFSKGKGIEINESQSYGGYRVTMLGIASGEGLSEYFREGGGKVRSDRTYAAVAIEHEDGSPMTAGSDEYGKPEDGTEEFFVSPVISGYHPAFYNAASMYGNYTEMLQEGILYRLVECDNVEIFADRKLYLCVSDGSVFYNSDAYCYDRETGEISRNEDYPGLNALFSLPLDASGADPEKAEQYILSLGITVPDISEEKRNIITEDELDADILQGNEKGAEAAKYALEFVGNPYVWGGESLTEGCDSSGFTKAVFEAFQISLPHSASEQKSCGEQVQGLENALPGDLVFYENPSHVGIYIGGGNIVHADPAYDICVSKADYTEIAMIRRILKDSEND